MYESSPSFLALHALRLKGFTSPEHIETLSGLPASTVELELRSLDTAGLVSYRSGRITGWTLTVKGRSEHADARPSDLEAPGCRSTVADAYRRFVTVNEPFLAVCTDWQLR